jgi:hypothetical protein
MRARAEEKLMSVDPRYVEYALAMNERSVLAFIGQTIPWFQFQAPGPEGPWAGRQPRLTDEQCQLMTSAGNEGIRHITSNAKIPDHRGDDPASKDERSKGGSWPK